MASKETLDIQIPPEVFYQGNPSYPPQSLINPLFLGGVALGGVARIPLILGMFLGSKYRTSGGGLGCLGKGIEIDGNGLLPRSGKHGPQKEHIIF